jgi:hypothetical protein
VSAFTISTPEFRIACSDHDQEHGAGESEAVGERHLGLGGPGWRRRSGLAAHVAAERPGQDEEAQERGGGDGEAGGIPPVDHSGDQQHAEHDA